MPGHVGLSGSCVRQHVSVHTLFLTSIHRYTHTYSHTYTDTYIQAYIFTTTIFKVSTTPQHTLALLVITARGNSVPAATFAESLALQTAGISF